MLAEAGPYYRETVNSPEWYHWQAAMNYDKASLEENCVFDLAPLSKDKKVIRVIWVIQRKRIQTDTKQARLFAEGYAH